MKRFATPFHMALLLAAGIVGSAGSALAAPIIYPAKGQTQQQQQADQGECHGWAVQNTGIDPASATC